MQKSGIHWGRIITLPKRDNPIRYSHPNLLLLCFFGSSSSSSSSPSIRRARKYQDKKRRKWPLSPYKARWQDTFNHQQAMEALKQSATKAPSTHLLSTLIDSFSIYDCDPTPSAYHFVLKSLALNSKWDQISLVLDRIEKVEKFETPECIFVDLIRTYSESDMIEDAVDLFFRIPNFRCVPSVDSLNSLLSELCKKRECIKIVPQILLKSQSMNIRVEESSYCILINALCRIKKVGYAVRLLSFMLNDGYCLDERLVSLILSTMCEDKDLSVVDILGFWEEMRSLGFEPQSVDWCNVIRFFVKKGKGMDALTVLKQMKMNGIKPSVICYTLVLKGIVAEGRFQMVDELFDELLMLGLVPDIHTYNAYINGLCKQSNVKEGLKMIACMEELGCKPDSVTYKLLLEGFCKAGKLSRAREMVKEMGFKGLKLDSQIYGIMINGLVKEGEIEEACGLLKQILDKGETFQSSSFDEMICGLCERGLISRALELLKEAVGQNVVPGVKTWKALLESSESQFTFEEALLDTEKAPQSELLKLAEQ